MNSWCCNDPPTHCTEPLPSQSRYTLQEDGDESENQSECERESGSGSKLFESRVFRRSNRIQISRSRSHEFEDWWVGFCGSNERLFVFCESEGKVFAFVFESEPARVFVGVGVGVLQGSNRKREEVEGGRNFPSSKQRRFGKGWMSMLNAQWGKSSKENSTLGFVAWRRGSSRKEYGVASAAAACGGGVGWGRVSAAEKG